MSEQKSPAVETLRLKSQIGYGLGNFATMIGKQAPKQLSLPVYNITLGVSPSSVSLILASGRLFDAFIDPFVGHWSDRSQTRWGRRRPFIFLGSILTGMFFALMWVFPRGLGENAYLAYYAVTSLLFYFALTLYSVPWYALGYEMAETYDQRTKLMAFPTAIGPVAQILVAWLFAFTQLDIFSDTIEGIRAVGLGAGVILVAFGLMPFFWVKEKALPVVPKTLKVKPPSFLDGMKASAKNRPFRSLTIAFTLILIGTSMVGGLGFYVHTYVLFGGDTKAASILNGWAGTLTQVVTIVCTPLAVKLSTRFGKKEVFMAAIACGVARMGILWFLLDPAHPNLVLINAALYGMESAAIFMLCHAMIADVCDLDELECGARREGLFGAVYAWIFKTGIALSYGLSGYILTGIGFDRALGGAQAGTTLLWMKIAYCVAPAAAFIAALFVLRGYTLNRSGAEVVRLKLAERHIQTQAG
ncbi:hypothetical protein IMCC26134_03025 [Verrucomicrobia bacterium IMCC26134]|nr:hypothetical protein IMCC26134_03025 [Verrucomicrobia bacterium IMCC26134]